MPASNQHTPVSPPSGDDLAILARSGCILLGTAGDLLAIPSFEEIAGLIRNDTIPLFLGTLAERRVFAVHATEEDAPRLPPGCTSQHLRDLIGLLPEDLFRFCGQALHLTHWDATHAFCGRCGAPCLPKPDERAKVCSSCALVTYPRISPAAIMAVVRNNEILLARNVNFKSGVYSVLAGFVEAGETLEECVAREVFEETHIRIKNIRYVGSQPWPFPDALMVGFIADYDSGDIVVDTTELIDAEWFSMDALPAIPPPGTAARMLIDHFSSTLAAH